jgi:DNA mismatch endonuclease (patch repair protein)
MVDMFIPSKRSTIMASIRSKGNRTTELRFVRLLRRHKIRGWRRGSKLLGKPDFVFSKEKIVVFVDGDFWHGNPRKYRIPKSNCTYWQKKIAGNKERDRRVSRALRKEGWAVIRIWESDLVEEEAIIAKLKLLL